ncbi:Kinesin [Macleaya cordata]|uniref:Kinesin-like protein n=1 Tax=Macleaya cordata TaxID=56857 RepID=A0A200RCH0_MACCD|nr:Kinesin [Macleaya cordata]
MGSVGGGELIHWEKMEMASPHEKILVSVRLRPLNAKEIGRNDVSDWECINDNTIIFKNSLPERSMYPTAYTFDRVFQSHCSTKQVYEEAAREVALSVVSGINSSIFAYGQTSSGKTYTMNGVTEYTVADIYNYIQKHEERVFALKFSAMEIYNEAVRDLLSGDATPLRLLDDPEVNINLVQFHLKSGHANVFLFQQRGTIIEKLTEETLRDWSHLKELLSVCEAQRRVGETLLNETSSRSHQILRLTVESSAHEFLGKDNSSTLSASVNFVDLAGSERASQALSAGTRLKEGCHINRSLLTLGTVIRKLSKGRNGHVPYRDSKLTRILQPSLGGNARTAIICTMSPARNHVEQSRNTLLFASCAKEVATNAHVNVVMSDKALVKHLQRELARLESELRCPGPTSATSDTAALLRAKDLQIGKMEKEIKELTQQRDLVQSRLDDLLQVVGDDRVSRLWADSDQTQISNAPKAWEYENSISESQGMSEQQFSDAGVTRFNTSRYSNEHSENHRDEYDLQLPGNLEDYFLSDGNSPQLPIDTPEFVGRNSCQGSEGITQGSGEDSDYLCKEVRCIEMEEYSTDRNVKSNLLSPEESEVISPFTMNANEDAMDQESVASIGKRDGELRRVCADYTCGAPKQKLQDVRKTIDYLAKPYPDESYLSPLDPNLPSSRSLQLTRSRSCRATLMTGSSSPGVQMSEENDNTSKRWFEKYVPGRHEEFERKIAKLSYGDNIENLSQEDSETSQQSAVIDELKGQEMSKVQCDKQFTDGQVRVQETKPNEDEPQKTVKDVGLDPMQEDPLESPSNWLLEFGRQQKEIIELWHTCNVSLVHRTYFFLLFKGDPTDLIYMEVEFRRLSFLKDKFSRGKLDKPVVERGRVLTPNSRDSMRALRREREMLSKRLQKKFSEEERRGLYQKWGISSDMNQRKLQLVNRLWTDTKDMDHIMESAALVAKLVGLVEPDKALKEMFGLSFTPWRNSRRFYSWKDTILPLLKGATI